MSFLIIRVENLHQTHIIRTENMQHVHIIRTNNMKNRLKVLKKWYIMNLGD